MNQLLAILISMFFLPSGIVEDDPLNQCLRDTVRAYQILLAYWDGVQHNYDESMSGFWRFKSLDEDKFSDKISSLSLNTDWITAKQNLDEAKSILNEKSISGFFKSFQSSYRSAKEDLSNYVNCIFDLFYTTAEFDDRPKTESEFKSFYVKVIDQVEQADSLIDRLTSNYPDLFK